MKLKKITYLMGLAAALLVAGCSKEEVVVNGGYDNSDGDPTGTPVLFTVGNLNLASTTRADVIPYMAQDGRFVCTMYYHSASTATAQNEGDFDIKHPNEQGTLSNAWLQVNNNVGNSVYRKNTFATPTNYDDNHFDFDKDATIFYWQNRLTHAFLALADYNKLTINTGDLTASTPGTLKLYPNYDKDMVEDPGSEGTEAEIAAYQNTLSDNRYANSYDLTRGENMTAMSDQPDPILALTLMKPGGATQEANRVKLYFKHQFSQIQVNIKDAEDNSASITAEQIDQVALLGVSKSAYVYCRLNKDGKIGASFAKEVHQDEFTEDELAVNEWGTSFLMFDMYKEGADNNGYATGYLKSYNAIAFGNLQAIRITWHESEHTDKVHVTTYRVPKTNETTTDNNSSTSDKKVVQLRQLQSGMKYIYNLELRRGTLAVIRTEIVDWNQHEDLVYDTNGTIQTSANQ